MVVVTLSLLSDETRTDAGCPQMSDHKTCLFCVKLCLLTGRTPPSQTLRILNIGK